MAWIAVDMAYEAALKTLDVEEYEAVCHELKAIADELREREKAESRRPAK